MRPTLTLFLILLCAPLVGTAIAGTTALLHQASPTRVSLSPHIPGFIPSHEAPGKPAKNPHHVWWRLPKAGVAKSQPNPQQANPDWVRT